MHLPRIIATTLSIALLAGCNKGGPAPDANSQAQDGASAAGASGEAASSAADTPGMVVWLQGNGLPPVGEYQLASADGAAIGKLTVDGAYRGIAWNEEQKLCFAAQHHPVGAGCYTVTKRARDGFDATNDKGAAVRFTPIAG